MLNAYLMLINSKREKIKFEEFYNKHSNFFLNYAQKFLKDRTKAEEAVHEAFLNMLENKEKYIDKPEKELRRLVTVLVRWRTLDLIRREDKISKSPIDEVEIYLEDNKKPVEEKVELQSELEIMSRYLKELDEITKQILIMKYVEDMSYREIGEIMGLTEGNARVKAYRGKEKIRNKMVKDGVLDEKN